MHSFLQDIRFSFRVLAKAPGFTVAAVVALGLGIGVNTATLSTADAFLIKPLALPTVERLVSVIETRAGQTSDWSGRCGSIPRWRSGMNRRAAPGRKSAQARMPVPRGK